MEPREEDYVAVPEVVKDRCIGCVFDGDECPSWAKITSCFNHNIIYKLKENNMSNEMPKLEAGMIVEAKSKWDDKVFGLYLYVSEGLMLKQGGTIWGCPCDYDIIKIYKTKRDGFETQFKYLGTPIWQRTTPEEQKKQELTKEMEELQKQVDKIKEQIEEL